jgi:glycosyltransferase involved in cell wall biosynthesis
MIWLAFPAMVIIGVRLAIVLYNLFTSPTLPDPLPGKQPLVSVLIPARNEEQNLPGLLEGLLRQQWDPMEIRVYDDASTDRTGEIVKKYAAADPRITLLKGEGPPGGWNGKNHACHQLAIQAKGSYFLFLDADVKVEADLIPRAVGYALRSDLTLLSLFPRQLMATPGELLSVPVMNWILLSLLPMKLTRTSHYPSLSAANGQMMLFRAREYRQHQFHRLVREINVEDIHIMRLVKRMGYPAEVLLSRGEVSCRMYRSYREGVFGLTRSMFAFFGGSGTVLILYTLFSTLGVVFVWLGLSPEWGLVYLALAAGMRIMIQYLSRQPVLRIVLWAPLIQFSFVWMVIQSFRMKLKGTHTWKDRTIQFKGI